MLQYTTWKSSITCIIVCKLGLVPPTKVDRPTGGLPCRCLQPNKKCYVWDIEKNNLLYIFGILKLTFDSGVQDS
jgi:hypothetical protein